MNSIKKADFIYNVLRMPLDFVMLLLAGFLTYFFRTEILAAVRPVLFDLNLPLLHFMTLVAGVALVFIGAYAIAGLYTMGVRMGRAEEFFKIIIGSSAGILIVIILIFLRQELFDSRFLV